MARNERSGRRSESSQGQSYNSSGPRDSQVSLSEAARKMRSSDPEERREGAALMGRVGGQHSHGGHRSGAHPEDKESA